MVYSNNFLFVLNLLWLLPPLQQTQGELLALKTKLVNAIWIWLLGGMREGLLQHFTLTVLSSVTRCDELDKDDSRSSDGSTQLIGFFLSMCLNQDIANTLATSNQCEHIHNTT